MKTLSSPTAGQRKRSSGRGSACKSSLASGLLFCGFIIHIGVGMVQLFLSHPCSLKVTCALLVTPIKSYWFTLRHGAIVTLVWLGPPFWGEDVSVLDLLRKSLSCRSTVSELWTSLQMTLLAKASSVCPNDFRNIFDKWLWTNENPRMEGGRDLTVP